MGDDGTKLFVGNITFQTRASELEELFAAYGKVIECRIAEDQGRPKGFAFITMENADDAEEAMRKLTGTQIDGRDIRVEKSSGTGRGGGGGGGGYRGGSRSDACYDWRAGRCNRGSSCKFSHDEGGGVGGGGGGRDYGRNDRDGRDGRDGRDRDGRSGRDDRDDRDFGRDRDRNDRRDSRDDRGGGSRGSGGRDRSRSRERDSGGYDRERRDRDRSRDRR